MSRHQGYPTDLSDPVDRESRIPRTGVARCPGVDSDGGNPTEVCSLPPAANQDWVKCFLIAPQRLE